MNSVDDKMYQAYLEEMLELEKFRVSHAAIYGETAVENEDPYTKRLIESLAFFGARARVQGTRKIVEIHQCLFRQYFPYLVSPLPAFAMLQLKPSIRYPEKVQFPPGTELVFKTANELEATFQTTDPVTVAPLLFKKFTFERRGDAGWRCLLEYACPHISTEEVGSFRLYINHLNSFISSLSVFFALQYSLEKVQVLYDKSAADENGQECAISYGNAHEERKVFNHIVEHIRSQLHFPQQELFINLEVPAAGKRWQSIAFCFDFDNRWPEGLKLTHDSFIPFVTPIINLKLASADPIFHDGTKDSHPVLYPEPTHQFELHTLVNALEILPQGFRPLKPGMLAIGEGGTYEIDYFNNRLSINLPDAFSDPKTVAVSALWTQPWFSNYINEELKLQFTEAETFGLTARLLGSIHRYEKTVEDDPNFLIRVLSLKNQNYLSLNEILFIMNTMKELNRSFFDSVPDCIQDLKINRKINQKDVSTLLEYEFHLKELGSQKAELVVLFFKLLNELLNCWLANFEIETKVHFPQHKKPLIFKRGSKNELSVLARNFFLS